MVLATPGPLGWDKKTRVRRVHVPIHAVAIPICGIHIEAKRRGLGCAGREDDPGDGIQACGSRRGRCREGNGGLGNRRMESRPVILFSTATWKTGKHLRGTGRLNHVPCECFSSHPTVGANTPGYCVNTKANHRTPNTTAVPAIHAVPVLIGGRDF